MKIISAKKWLFGFLMAGLVIAPGIAQASIITDINYTWQPDTGMDGAISSSGSLTLVKVVNGSSTTYSVAPGDFSFTYGGIGTETSFSPYSSYFTILPNGDLILSGVSSGANPTIAWNAYNEGSGSLAENQAAPTSYSQSQPTIYGNWVQTPANGNTVIAPVPEATTLLAGALLLLPFGASALRGMRKNGQRKYI